MASQATRLVMFDTNVAERYLAPMLSGQRCDVFAMVRACGYEPAVGIRSLYEIWHHAKMGIATFDKRERYPGYPGGVDQGKAILARMHAGDSERNVYWWFGQCEEWRGLDWEDERDRVRRLVRPNEQAAALIEIETRSEFSAWKFGLQAFCERIWDALNAECRVLTERDVAAHGAHRPLLEQIHSLATKSIVPTEDLELWALALCVDAAAFVTEDRKLSCFAGLSTSLDHRCAVLHPRQLSEALQRGVPFRWSREQTRP